MLPWRYVFAGMLQAAEVAFDRLLAYDDVCFIGRGNPVRGEFLRRWIRLPGGAAYVAVEDGGGRVTGYGCRRPCIDKQPRTHLIGPLYADSPDIAEALLRRLCADVIGQTVVLQFWWVSSVTHLLLRLTHAYLIILFIPSET